jgi:LysR family transcriptional regulator (chromosome initiation inhibitor)
MGQLDYRGLAVLDAVAVHGSFDRAALALGISQSAVSQRIKALEDATGRLLVVRGSPSVPTGLGQRLVTHHRHVQLMEAALDIDLGREESLPRLALAVDPDSLATWLADALPAMLTPPRCQLQVQVADSAHALQLVREGAVFACIAGATGNAEAPQGTSSHSLGVLRHRCVATPAFAAHWFGDGFCAEAVQLAPAVVSEHTALAPFLAKQLGWQGAFPHHQLPPSSALTACITGGVAYGLLPEPLALRYLANDVLVDLLPGAGHDVPLHWHAWNIDTPFTRALTEHMVAAARRCLRQR